MRWLLAALLALAACGSSKGPTDAGSDAGPDAGPPVTDGGALGAACSSLDQCAGNPICGLSQECPFAVICADGLCASAGGLAASLNIALTVESSKLPSYVQLYALAPQLVGAGTLDCGGLDGGTINPNLRTVVNPLFVSYAQNVEAATKGVPYDFELEPSATGTGRVLYLQGYLRAALADGGDELVGTGCMSFSDAPGDGGSVGIALDGP